VPTPNLTENDEDRPPVAAIRIKGTRRKRALALSAAALLLVGGAAAWSLWPSPKPAAAAPCAACVTDGAPPFAVGSPAMRQVQSAIATENAKVRKAGPYVTIALLNPLTTGPLSDVPLPRMIDQLRAAYLAQMTMNASGSPGVQLLLANEGTGTELSAGKAVQQLETLEGAPDHLVAVAGLGLSIDATVTAAQTLAGNGMPMFGAVTSADEFNDSLFADLHLGGASALIQVVPDVSAQVRRLAAVIGRPPEAFVVYDQQATDLYTGDLQTDFTRVFSASVNGRPESPYTPGSEDSIEFKGIAEDVCAGPTTPDVLYAGRASVLAELVKQLEDEIICSGKKITVVTAGDADGLDPRVTESTGGLGQVSVIYSDIVNVDRLTTTFRSSYADNPALAAMDSKAASLTDPWTIATYDSMMAAWTAIETADLGLKSGLPTADDVAQLAEHLGGENAVAGATGPLSFTPDGQLTSLDIPVFEDAGGKRRTLASLAFAVEVEVEVEVDPHDRPAHARAGDLGQAGLGEDLAGADVQLPPGDLPAGLGQHRVALERPRAVRPGVADGGLGQGVGEAAPAVALADHEAGDRPDRVVLLVLVRAALPDGGQSQQSRVLGAGLDRDPADGDRRLALVVVVALVAQIRH
jgi:ABC-type branched-subunit amino acid transport system substrate-binding protein